MREKHRWYRGYLVAIGCDLAASLWYAISDQWLWFIPVALFFAYLNWTYYKSSKRRWTELRDEAYGFFREAIEAVPEFAKKEGSHIALNMNGFQLKMEWNDDGWVTKASKS